MFRECRGSPGCQASLGCQGSPATSKESKATSAFPACLVCRGSLVCQAPLELLGSQASWEVGVTRVLQGQQVFMARLAARVILVMLETL